MCRGFFLLVVTTLTHPHMLTLLSVWREHPCFTEIFAFLMLLYHLSQLQDYSAQFNSIANANKRERQNGKVEKEREIHCFKHIT